MPRQIAHYGWIPDLPDHWDYLYYAYLTSRGLSSDFWTIRTVQ